MSISGINIAWKMFRSRCTVFKAVTHSMLCFFASRRSEISVTPNKLNWLVEFAVHVTCNSLRNLDYAVLEVSAWSLQRKVSWNNIKMLVASWRICLKDGACRLFRNVHNHCVVTPKSPSTFWLPSQLQIPAIKWAVRQARRLIFGMSPQRLGFSLPVLWVFPTVLHTYISLDCHRWHI